MRRMTAWAALPFMAATPALAGPVPPHSAYVAMGSSFAAGPWIGDSADSPPNRCGRSVVNYAHLLAGKLGLDLTDVTCSGAKASHLVDPWDEIPAQVAAVTAQTRLVTITIGGNDLNYMGTIGAMACARMPADQARVFFHGAPCPTVTLPTAADEARVAQTLRSAIARIHATAPTARVILVQYFNLFAGAPNCATTGVTDAQALALQTLAGELAALTAAAAHDAGVEVLALDQASRPHGICSASPWVNGNHADRAAGDGTFYHPNRAGMAATAELLGSLITGNS